MQAVKNNYKYTLLILPALFIIAYSLGFRASFVGSDTIDYIRVFKEYIVSGKAERFSWLFKVMMLSSSYISTNPQYLFFITIIINLFLIAVNSNLISRQLWKPTENLKFALIVFLISFVSPFFLAAQVNVIRQGLSISFIFLFYLLLLNRSSIISILLSGIIAQGFHPFSILFLLPAFGLIFSYKAIVKIVFAFAFIYLTGAISYLVYQLSDIFNWPLYESIMHYGNDTYYVSGPRYKFIFFTLGIGILSDLLGRYSLLAQNRESYFRLLKIYWLLTIPFFIIGFGRYSDRLLLPCWNFLPFIFAIFLKKLSDYRVIPIYVLILGAYNVAFIYLTYNFYSK